jgi:hypothetical protein
MLGELMNTRLTLIDMVCDAQKDDFENLLIHRRRATRLLRLTDVGDCAIRVIGGAYCPYVVTASATSCTAHLARSSVPCE